MPYIGRDTDKISNVEVLDNITFDGSSSYTLQKGGSNFTPSSANTLLLSIDGVVQAGNFTVSGSTIDFGTAVAGTSTCDFVLHYGVGLITLPSDGTVTETKIGTGAVTSTKLADSSVTTAKLNDASVSLAKLTATGTKDATTFLRGDNTFAEAGGGGTILQSVNAFKIDVQSFNYNTGRTVVSGLNVTLPNSVASDSKLFITGVLSAGGDANGDPGVSPLWEYSTNNSTWQTVQRTTWQTSTGHAGTDSNSNVGNSMGYDGWGHAADIKHSAWSTMCSASDVSQARYYRVTVRQTDNTNNTVRINGNYDNSQGFAPSGISSIVVMEIGS